MLELPHEMRDQLVEHLDEYASNLSDTSDVEAIAQRICAFIELAAVEAHIDDASDILANLEASGELDATLVEVLEEQLGDEEDLALTGEDFVTIIEKLCEIDWVMGDDDEEGEDEGDEEERMRDTFFGGEDEDY